MLPDAEEVTKGVSALPGKDPEQNKENVTVKDGKPNYLIFLETKLDKAKGYCLV